ncbi:hypothetical protein RQP50_18105 [Paenibacillus sp. chi10]|uniref:Uncharacterized protein n=1 Tax=Paenibacillus suaedae TaxID=3077233 RepID=A0AAJ2K1L8_9BACL|nr:hypothetical protein [Paenibacillus sp. chi10]MDT8978143.1 hypothetical protein [Paenibacillus sp. chi10]
MGPHQAMADGVRVEDSKSIETITGCVLPDNFKQLYSFYNGELPGEHLLMLGFYWMTLQYIEYEIVLYWGLPPNMSSTQSRIRRTIFKKSLGVPAGFRSMPMVQSVISRLISLLAQAARRDRPLTPAAMNRKRSSLPILWEPFIH